jgi:hypothetical protein
MDKDVIGYYYKVDEIVLQIANIKTEELINSKIQLCFGTIVLDDKIQEEISDEIFEKMLNQNIGEVVEVQGQILKIIFKYPIPEYIFRKYYTTEELIYKT